MSAFPAVSFIFVSGVLAMCNFAYVMPFLGKRLN